MYIHICVYQASHSIVGGLDTRIGLVRGLGSQGQGWRQPEQATVLIMIYGLGVWFLYPLFGFKLRFWIHFKLYVFVYCFLFKFEIRFWKSFSGLGFRLLKPF